MKSAIVALKKKYNRLPMQVKASFWFLVCSFLQKAVSVITTPIFTRLLNTSEYGEYNVFNSWMAIIAIFVTLDLSMGVYTQGLIKFSKERNIFSSSLQGLTITLVFFWTSIYLLFHSFWNNLFSLTTAEMLSMLGLIWSSAVFSFWAGEQRVLYKYKNLVFITLIVSVARPTLGIILVKNSENKVLARIIGMLIVDMVAYIWLYIDQMRRGKVFFSKKYWKYAILYNLPLVPHYLSQTVLNNTDRIMIGRMVGNSEAGIYSLAYSVALIMTLFNTALMQTMSPWMYQKIKDRKIKDIAPIAYLSLAVIACVNLLLIAFAPEIVRIFAPSEYYDAIWVIPPVAMSAFFMYSYDLYAKFAFYYEKTLFLMFGSIISAAANIVLNYIFIKKYGYIAAGYTTLACYLIYVIAHYLFMIKVCNSYCDHQHPYNTKIIFGISTSFLLCGFLLLFTYKNIIVRYIAISIMIMILILKRKSVKDMANKLLSIRKGKNND